jgi:hypothetical protein
LRNDEVNMKAIVPHAGVDRRILLSTLAPLPALLFPTGSDAQAQLRECRSSRGMMDQRSSDH